MKFTADFKNEAIYGYIADNHASCPMPLFEAGLSLPAKDYNISYERRDYYSFEYIYEGSGTITCGLNTFIVNEGDFYWLTPDSNVSFTTNNDNPWKKIWCFIPENMFIFGLLQSYGLHNVTLLSKLNNCLQLEEIYDIAKAHGDEPETPRRLEQLMFQMIYSLSDVAPSFSAHLSLPEQIKNYIDDNLRQNISVEDICRQFFISKSKLFRTFVSAFEQSPTEYIKLRKIELSKKLLLNTSMSISQISEHLGFLHPGSFSNMFVKNVGIYPSEFRGMKHGHAVKGENLPQNVILRGGENKAVSSKYSGLLPK